MITTSKFCYGILLAITFALLFPLQSRADSVTLLDGSTRQGTILEETAQHVRINDPNVGIISIPRNQIRQLERTSAGNSVADRATLLAHATAEQNRKNYPSALSYYLQALKIASDQDTSLRFQGLIETMILEGKQRAATYPDQSRQLFQALYAAVSDPLTPTIYTSFPGSKTFQHVSSEVFQGYAEANVQLAQRMETDISLRTQALGLYKDAVALTQGKNADYMLRYANAAQLNSDTATAFQMYKSIIDNRLGSSEQLAAAYERANRISAESNNQYQLTPSQPLQTPAIPAVPATTVAIPPTVPPTVQSAEAIGPALPWHQTLWNSIKSGKIFNDALRWSKDNITPEMLTIVAVVAGLWILLWILPYQILKFLARRGDSEAGERLLNARKFGIFSLLGYLKHRASQARATRHRCPFCNKGIDNMDEYKDLNFVVCPHCREPITPVYEINDYIDHLITQLKISQKANAKGHRGDLLIEKNAMLKLVRGVLSLSIRRRASDIHLETLNEGGKVRARIDGIMYELLVLPREISAAFISALKVMANLDITERRIPQDGKIPFFVDQKDFDLRINTSPASMGEKVVIRILRQDSINMTPDRLGLDGKNLEIYQRNIQKPHGVIIVTGPSGSGKSTSLYVALNELNNGEKNIVTIEDPIEYQLKGLSQMQVNPAANFTFANGLRSILRQDPDVIMVGEIRDKETAEAALDAAMTGHLVLTTLHTIDAPTAFSRMRDLGIEQVRVSSAVTLVIAQRLVRTICPDCRKTYTPRQADLDTLEISTDSGIEFIHGTGCDNCMNTGFHGRLAIFEMLEITDPVRSLLETNSPTMAIREEARLHGMRSLREEGIRKIRENLTTVEEVIRVTTR